jgi:hypothetical protein
MQAFLESQGAPKMVAGEKNKLRALGLCRARKNADQDCRHFGHMYHRQQKNTIELGYPQP